MDSQRSVARADWIDKCDPRETRTLAVSWGTRIERGPPAAEKTVAHVTVPFDRSNPHLYRKIPGFYSWLRKQVADRHFSVRRSATVANGTEIVADMKANAYACVSLIEELVRFNMHDSTSERLFPSANVVQLPRGHSGLNFLDTSVERTAFVVRVGRVTGVRIHVYTSEEFSEPRVVVLGAEHSVMVTVETLKAALQLVANGKDHCEARNWVVKTLEDMFRASASGSSSTSPHPATPSPTPREPHSAAVSPPPPVDAGVGPEAASSIEQHGDQPPSPPSLHALYISPPPPQQELQQQLQPPLLWAPQLQQQHMQQHMPPMSVPPHIAAQMSVARVPPPDAPSLFTCLWCRMQPRRVAFKPCLHLVLCTTCADAHMKNRGPCPICGAHVVQRESYYVELAAILARVAAGIVRVKTDGCCFVAYISTEHMNHVQHKKGMAGSVKSIACHPHQAQYGQRKA